MYRNQTRNYINLSTDVNHSNNQIPNDNEVSNSKQVSEVDSSSLPEPVTPKKPVLKHSAESLIAKTPPPHTGDNHAHKAGPNDSHASKDCEITKVCSSGAVDDTDSSRKLKNLPPSGESFKTLLHQHHHHHSPHRQYHHHLHSLQHHRDRPYPHVLSRSAEEHQLQQQHHHHHHSHLKLQQSQYQHLLRLESEKRELLMFEKENRFLKEQKMLGKDARSPPNVTVCGRNSLLPTSSSAPSPSGAPPMFPLCHPALFGVSPSHHAAAAAAAAAASAFHHPNSIAASLYLNAAAAAAPTAVSSSLTSASFHPSHPLLPHIPASLPVPSLPLPSASASLASPNGVPSKGASSPPPPSSPSPRSTPQQTNTKDNPISPSPSSPKHPSSPVSSAPPSLPRGVPVLSHPFPHHLAFLPRHATSLGPMLLNHHPSSLPHRSPPSRYHPYAPNPVSPGLPPSPDNCSRSGSGQSAARSAQSPRDTPSPASSPGVIKPVPVAREIGLNLTTEARGVPA